MGLLSMLCEGFRNFVRVRMSSGKEDVRVGITRILISLLGNLLCRISSLYHYVNAYMR